MFGLIKPRYSAKGGQVAVVDVLYLNYFSNCPPQKKGDKIALFNVVLKIN